MSQVRTAVEATKNGSTQYDAGSGISVMSDSLIAFHPAIDEPSNINPSANASSSMSVWSKVTCCHLPRGSVKRRSTYLTSLSLIALRTSLAVFIIYLSSRLKFRSPNVSQRTAPGGRIAPLDGVRAGLPGADANDFLDRRYKYLAIADAAGLGGASNRLDGGCKVIVGDDEFDFHLRQKVDDVFGSPVKLGMPFLPSEAFRFGHGNALDSGLLQRFLYLIELERLDDRLDLLHFRRNSARTRAVISPASASFRGGSYHRRRRRAKAPVNGVRIRGLPRSGQKMRKPPIIWARDMPIYTVGAHSPEAKTRHALRPDFATTTRPLLALLTR